jgi:hypothetical protein
MSEENTFASASLTAEQLNALVKKVGGPENVLQILRGTIEVITKVISYIVATFIITVDETVSVEDAVKTGKFDWSDDDITSTNFPKITNGQKWDDKEVTIFHFNKTMTLEAVIAEMDKAGYKPANIWALIGLAVKEPDLQRKFQIVGLGSVCKLGGDRRVPRLYGDSSLRDLGLGYFDVDWNDDYRFAGVRK